MGNNQRIATVGYGLVFIASLVLVLAGKVKGGVWLDWSLVFAPLAVSTILVPSAAIKSITALAKRPPKPNEP